jgi:hypothetical protein
VSISSFSADNASASHGGGDRRDHRDTTCRNEIQYRPGVDLLDVTDEADVGGDTVDGHAAPHRGEQLSVLTGDADGVGPVGVDQPDEFTADLTEQHHPGHVEHFRCGDAKSTLEVAGDAEPGEHRADLRAAAVHDDRVNPAVAQEHHVGREGRLEHVVGHGVAAVLDHDDLAVQLLEPWQRLREHGRLGRRVDTHDE